MEKKIKIAFDLDGVIIDKPPLIPKKLLEKLFRGFKNKGLHYRFPKTQFEQQIRKLSHFYLFRPPIKKNIEFIKKLALSKKYELYVVSGRYLFLKNQTENWLEKRGLTSIFKKVFINLNNEQPHLYKEKMLAKIGADIYVDDDFLLADYLSKNKNCRIFCYSSKGEMCQKASRVRELKEIIK